MGNVLMSAAILFAGLTHAACLSLLFFTQPVFDRYQKEVLFPVVREAWELKWEGTVSCACKFLVELTLKKCVFNFSSITSLMFGMSGKALIES